MTLDDAGLLLINTYGLCRDVSSVEAIAKAQRAVAFHWKLVDQEIFKSTPMLDTYLTHAQGC